VLLLSISPSSRSTYSAFAHPRLARPSLSLWCLQSFLQLQLQLQLQSFIIRTLLLLLATGSHTTTTRTYTPYATATPARTHVRLETLFQQ
jgi:hypothetical protein